MCGPLREGGRCRQVNVSIFGRWLLALWSQLPSRVFGLQGFKDSKFSCPAHEKKFKRHHMDMMATQLIVKPKAVCSFINHTYLQNPSRSFRPIPQDKLPHPSPTPKRYLHF